LTRNKVEVRGVVLGGWERDRGAYGGGGWLVAVEVGEGIRGGVGWDWGVMS